MSIPFFSRILPAVRPTSLLPRLPVAPALAALVSVLLLLPAGVARAQEPSNCQTKRCWFEVVELIISSDTLTIFILSTAAAYVAKNAFQKGKKERKVKALIQKLEATEEKLNNMKEEEKDKLRKENKALKEKIENPINQKKSQPAEEENQA